ncbi:unnamed protein product [Trifolium pratense]|uniref:Uncharacterized protein n=1 Tax=Trifolium pratense TaxID=57577 RepID=A0ACB0L1G9_TRIPR|nr:unnamed protein product [Trifolium pratense]
MLDSIVWCENHGLWARNGKDLCIVRRFRHLKDLEKSDFHSSFPLQNRESFPFILFIPKFSFLDQIISSKAS